MNGMVLLDVNLLLAYGWSTHPDHQQCRLWISGLTRFGTCAITELGFLRVSMSPGYRAKYEDAIRVLHALTSMKGAAFFNCDLEISGMTPVASYKETTDCYLVELARKHSMRLATLDEGILKAAWAKASAFRPF